MFRLTHFKTNQKFQKIIIYLFLTVCFLLIYHTIYRFDFISLDDGPHLYQNSLITDASFASLLEFWKKPYFGLYIPATYSTWWCLAKIIQTLHVSLSPLFFHVLNGAFHAINVSLAYVLISLFLSMKLSAPKSRKEIDLDHQKQGIGIAAGLGAFFFLAHPVQVESVCWISCLKDLQATSLSFLSILCFYSPRIQSLGKGLRNFLPLFAFALGILSKPSVIVVPLILIMLETAYFSTTLKTSLKKLWPWFGLAIVTIVITKSQQPEARMIILGSWVDRFCVAGYALCHYFFKIFLPYPLLIEYPLPKEKVINDALSSIAWLLPFLLLCTWKWQKPWLRVGLLFSGLGLLPILGWVPFEFQNFSIVTDHYLYFPIWGVAWVFSNLVYSAWNRRKSNFLLTAGCLLGVLMIPYSTYQTQNWKNSVSIFTQSLSGNPTGYLSLFSLGKHYSEVHDYQNALTSYLSAYRALPRSIPAQQLIGSSYMFLNRYLEAIQFYQKIFAFNQVGSDIWSRQAYALVRNDYAAALLHVGQTTEAIEQLKIAASLDPSNQTIRDNLAKF